MKKRKKIYFKVPVAVLRNICSMAAVNEIYYRSHNHQIGGKRHEKEIIKLSKNIDCKRYDCIHAMYKHVCRICKCRAGIYDSNC